VSVDVSAEQTDAPMDGLVRAGDARAGAIMQVIAVVGVVVAIVGGAVGWVFLSDLDRNLDQSLAIGADAASALSDTIDVADQVVTDLDAGLGDLLAILDTVVATTGDTGDMASTAADVAGRLPATFDDVDTALGTVEQLSGTVDGALRTLSAVPFGPDYDPDEPLPDAVADLRSAFEPIGADLEELSTSLESFSGRTTDLADEVDAIRTDVERTRSSLDESDRLLDRYRETAADAERLAVTSRDDFDQSLRWARWTAIALAAFVVVAQFVPWWLGRRRRAV
jgi:ABC-type transporter Mla subunit MlaD